MSMSFDVPNISPRVKPPGVYFSMEQWEYLNKTFPESVFDYSASLAEVMHTQGKRSVVHFIKDRIR